MVTTNNNRMVFDALVATGSRKLELVTFALDNVPSCSAAPGLTRSLTQALGEAQRRLRSKKAGANLYANAALRAARGVAVEMDNIVEFEG